MSPTVEGSVTSHYIADMAEHRGVTATRIAHGVPLGGELEYVDGGTLAHAFAGRRSVDRGFTFAPRVRSHKRVLGFGGAAPGSERGTELGDEAHVRHDFR